MENLQDGIPRIKILCDREPLDTDLQDGFLEHKESPKEDTSRMVTAHTEIL